MFTPQRKAPWTPPSSAARTTTSFRLTAAEKGKSLAFIDGGATPTPSPPPPRTSFESGIVLRGENLDDWKRFKEAGLLDESSLERKDSQALIEKISRLEKELFDYQYNMGLLLIEKKNLVLKTEELGHEFAEAQEILKREKTAYLIAVSEAEQREESLKKALGVEKKGLADLERALRDMHEEHAKLKALSETSVTDVNSHMEMLEKTKLDVDAKVHAADAKLASADRMNSELDRKLHDVESRERILQRERLSLANEKEAHQTYFQKHKKDLIEWERKLQEGEQKLCDGRRILKAREEKLDEFDRTSKDKEAYMNELQQKIDLADATLKKMERDMEIRLADLDSKEKRAETQRCELDITEKKLVEKEKRLSARESVELENLLSRHKIELDAKMHEFDLEMKKKRNSVEEELSTNLQEIDAKKRDIIHLEEMLGKREQALEKKSERVKEKEKDIDEKIKALKEREKTVKAEVKSVELEKKAINTDKEGLEDLRKDLERWRTNMREQELQIEQEQKEVEVLQEERSNYIRLQTNLKQEFEIARRQSELIEKEAVDLKLERQKFENDWEALDEKRADVDNKLKKLAEERERFEKIQNSEEDRLKREKAEREEDLRVESESLRLEKESFEAAMEHQKKMYDENAKNEHNLMLRDFERERQDFVNDVKKRQNVWEEMMEAKERAFEERKLKEMLNLSRLKEDAERQKKHMETERFRVEKERGEMELLKNQLEKTRIEMTTEAQDLGNLSKTRKQQREEFASERRLFIAFIERIKGCRDCGDSAQAFLHCDLQLPYLDESAPKESSAKMSLSPDSLNRNNLKSGGFISRIQKCTSIFTSPKAKDEPLTDRIADKSPSSASPLTASNNGPSEYGLDEGKLKMQNFVIDECGPSSRIANGSLKNSPSDAVNRTDSIDTAPSVDFSNMASAEQGVQESENTVSKTGRRKPVKKRGPGVRRTHSVKAVVEGSTGTMDDVSRQEDSVGVEMKPPTGARKRTRLQSSRVTESEQDPDYSEDIADSATTGGRRKKRQTVAALPTLGQSRYNLRRHAAVETASAEHASSGKPRNTASAEHASSGKPRNTASAEQASSGKPRNQDDTASIATDQIVQNPRDMPTQSLDVAVDSSSKLNLAQVSTPRSIEIASHKIVRFSPTDIADNHFDAAKSPENSPLTGETKPGDKKMTNEEANENGDDPDDSNIEEGEDEDGDGYDSDGHPGQRSIGKTLWSFFTT